jgi:hypothetical protein
MIVYAFLKDPLVREGETICGLCPFLYNQEKNISSGFKKKYFKTFFVEGGGIGERGIEG